MSRSLSAASAWEIAIKHAIDRLLIAQAQLEGLAITTADIVFARYEVTTASADS